MKTKTAMTALLLGLGVTVTALPALADRMGMGMGGGAMMGGMPTFADLDADKDGKLTEAEVLAWRQARVSGADADKDGRITRDELIAQELKGAQQRAEARADRRIAAHDLDGDGALTVEELLAMPVSPMMFGMADADNDGTVSAAEFDAMHARIGGRGDGPRCDGGPGMGLGMGMRGQNAQGQEGHGMGRGLMRGYPCAPDAAGDAD